MPLMMYAHLPGVRLDDGTSGFPLGQGQVDSLPFERWLELDDEFRHVEKKYERSRPAFWVGELAVSDPGDKGEIMGAAEALLWRLHVAFLLEPRTPLLPAPWLSALYFVLPPPPELAELGPFVVRQRGPMEREWIVFGSPLSYSYDAADFTDVGKVFTMFGGSGAAAAFAGLEAGIEALERTARPDSWWGGEQTLRRASEFVHCIGGSEAILLPPPEERTPGTLTETFGRHGAALVARSRDEFAARAAEITDLYRLRSRLVHGRIGLRDLHGVQAKQLSAGRALLRAVILGAMALGRSASGAESLPHLLSRAATDPTAHGQLLDRLGWS